MKFEYINRNGNEQWWMENQMVPQTVYELAFKSQYGLMTQDMNCVGFEDMIRLISDGDKVGYFKTPYKTYKFYAEKDTDFNDVIIKVQFDDEDVEFGDFFQEYEYISDWIEYKFTVKPAPRWMGCTLKTADIMYERLGNVRVEVNGVIEKFNKLSHGTKGLIEVATIEQIRGEWECEV